MDLSPDVSRELVFAYTDAAERRDDEDRAYAFAQIEDFIADTGDDTPDDVLIPLLDLPLEGITLPLLSAVSAMLRRRGPGVVEPLLVAAVGEGLPGVTLRDVVGVAGAVGALLEAATRSPGGSPRVENALSVLDALPSDDLIRGLVWVLESRRDDHVKQVASDMLVDIGDDAVDDLTTSLRDRDADLWVADTLAGIKARQGEDWRNDPGDDDDDGAKDGWAGDADADVDTRADAHDGARDGHADKHRGDAGAGVAGEHAGLGAGGQGADLRSAPRVDPAASPTDPPPIVGPDPGRLDADFDAFRRRFDEEAGRE
ncbi:MAG TPA: hypothetical protein VK576_10305 [Thermoleophilia bacterium]|nr:hypothetical protein [Thermoleophilia bacterium]